MSKQQVEVERNLKLLFPDLQREVDLNKIVKKSMNSGIRVDIWIPSINCIVEVHGIQHHKPSGFGSDKITTKMKFNDQVNRDSKLVTFCQTNGINYEQIDYNGKSDFSTLFRQFSKYCEEE